LKLYNVNGRLVGKDVVKYRINWNKKCRSKIQFKVKQFLAPYWRNHICFEEFPVFGTRLKVDMINFTRKVAVEVQGKQHYSFNKFFHANSRMKYLDSIKRDSQKYQWLEMNNIKLIEVLEDEVDTLSKKFFYDKFDLAL
jgi:hypothetical protein